MATHDAGTRPAVKAGRAAATARRDRAPAESRPPVFVDATGRRERLWRRASMLLAAAAAAYVMAVGTNLLAEPVEPQGPSTDLDGARPALTGETSAPPALRVEND